MKRVSLEVRLLTPAVFTASGGSVGRPESLDRVPGATLLGAAARRLYGSLPDAFEVFHLGECVRFLDGLPVAGPEGGPALPTPLSWHREKYAPEHVYDLSSLSREEVRRIQERGGRAGGQIEQLRGGYVHRADGGWRRRTIRPVASLRTAITEEGSAREGLLHGFEAVPAGSRFVAAVEGEDGLVDRVVEVLQGRQRLGRSRSAEYGLVEVSVRDGDPWAGLHGAPLRPGMLRFLCLSDLWLRDSETGAPRTPPAAEDVGLPAGWRFVPERSFLRFRRYSPFNGARRRPDLERQVIVAGSVLCFAGEGEPDVDAILAGLERRVGEGREAGLGVLLLEPEVFAEDRPALASLEAAPAEGAQRAAEPPGDPLAGWLVARAAERQRERAIWAAVRARIEAARRWGVPRAQWGRVRALAAEMRRRGGSRDELLRRLQTEIVDHGISAELWMRGRGEALVRWAREVAAGDAAAFLELLATHVERGEDGDHSREEATR